MALSVTYNPNYLFALHNHQREKIIFFYFGQLGMFSNRGRRGKRLR